MIARIQLVAKKKKSTHTDTGLEDFHNRMFLSTIAK